MDRVLYGDLVKQMKNILSSIQDTAERSRGKFVDRKSGEDFYKSIHSDIEKIDLLLEGFINYVNSTTPPAPPAKRRTINTQIDEVLKEHQVRLDQKQFRVFRKLDDAVTESIVPHEQMIFILDSILQYAEASISAGSIIEIETRALDIEAEADKDQSLPGTRSRHARILFAFIDRNMPFPEKDGSLDLLLRLVLHVVERNQGTMALEADKAKTKKSIILLLPTERRNSI